MFHVGGYEHAMVVTLRKKKAENGFNSTSPCPCLNTPVEVLFQMPWKATLDLHISCSIAAVSKLGFSVSPLVTAEKS